MRTDSALTTAPARVIPLRPRELRAVPSVRAGLAHFSPGRRRKSSVDWTSAMAELGRETGVRC